MEGGDGGAAALIGSTPPHLNGVFTKESTRRSAAFRPRPTDVFIATYPKTGTTFLQQLCHQVRTAGEGCDTDFEDIYQRVPFEDAAWDMGDDLDAEQFAEPRLFKSHQLLSGSHPGAKFISCVRDPGAAAASLYRFSHNPSGDEERCNSAVAQFASASEYARSPWFSETGPYNANIWQYQEQLWRCRQLPNVLVLVYEDLAADVDRYIPLIADFLGVPPLTAEQRRRVAELCGKEYMLAHSDRFSERYAARKMRAAGRNVAGRDDGAGWEAFDIPTPKVTAGARGAADAIDADAAAFLEARWAATVGAGTGLADYAALRASVAGEVRARAGRLPPAAAP